MTLSGQFGVAASTEFTSTRTLTHAARWPSRSPCHEPMPRSPWTAFLVAFLIHETTCLISRPHCGITNSGPLSLGCNPMMNRFATATRRFYQAQVIKYCWWNDTEIPIRGYHESIWCISILYFYLLVTETMLSSIFFIQTKLFLYQDHNICITLRNNFRTCSNFEHFCKKVFENRTLVFGRWSNCIRSIFRCSKIERLELEHYFMCSKIDQSNVERLPCVLL